MDLRILLFILVLGTSCCCNARAATPDSSSVHNEIASVLEQANYQERKVDVGEANYQEKKVDAVEEKYQESKVDAVEEFGAVKQLCTLCKNIAKPVLSFLSNTDNQKKIKNAFTKICSITFSLKEKCQSTVNSFLPLVWAQVMLWTPQTFCATIKLCDLIPLPPLTPFPPLSPLPPIPFIPPLSPLPPIPFIPPLSPLPPFPFLPPIPFPPFPFRPKGSTSTYEDSSENSCEACKELVAQVLLELKDPKKQLETTEFLLKACDALDEFEGFPMKCKNIVSSYAPFILSYTRIFLESHDICSTLLACSSATSATELVDATS